MPLAGLATAYARNTIEPGRPVPHPHTTLTSSTSQPASDQNISMAIPSPKPSQHHVPLPTPTYSTALHWDSPPPAIPTCHDAQQSRKEPYRQSLPVTNWHRSPEIKNQEPRHRDPHLSHPFKTTHGQPKTPTDAGLDPIVDLPPHHQE